MAKIGKNLIKMFMFDLYSQPETIYREYIQNAFDSINIAIKQEILKSDDGHISIEIDKNKYQIIITDNGTGISVIDSEAFLTNIAMSPKENDDESAGFHGIGRLVGAGYCKKLTFKTSYFGEDKASELVFDVDKIRNLLKDKNEKIEAAEILEQSISFDKSINEVKDEHYFSVTLSEILPEYIDFLLDKQRIHDYLVQIAPVDFNMQFKNVLIKSSVEKIEDEELKDCINNLQNVKITLRDDVHTDVDIRKKYSFKIEGTGDEISELRYFLLKDPRFGKLAWGWYAITRFSTAIPDVDSKTKKTVLTRGMRLRVHNIQIGEASYFDKFFKQNRSNNYFNGEVHIIHENIKPTPERSDLSPTAETLAFNEEVAKFFNTEMQAVYQNANKVKNILKTIYETVPSEKEKIDARYENKEISEEEKNDLLKVQDDVEQRANEDMKKNLLEKTPKTDGEKAMLEVYKKELAEKEKKPVQSHTLPSSRSVSEKKKEIDIIDVVKELSSFYTDEQMKIIKRIFEIIDTRFYQESYITFTKPLKSTLLKELKK